MPFTRDSATSREGGARIGQGGPARIGFRELPLGVTVRSAAAMSPTTKTRRSVPGTEHLESIMAATRIDCDIHPAVGGTRTTLLPYLDDHWKEQVVSRAIDGLDLNSYPVNMPLSRRPGWRPPR